MELLLSICLVSSPADCRSENITVSMEATAPMACMMTAQQTIAQWQESHPKWRVARWKCGQTSRKQVAI